MYELITAYSRKDRRNGRWVEVDVTDEPVKFLYQTFGDVWFIITYPSLDGVKGLRLDDVQNLLNPLGPLTSVSEWLISVGNTTLPFTDDFPEFTTGYVKYANAWHAGYQLEPISRIGTVEQGGSKWDKEDLLISRSDIDPEYLVRNVLFSVNGLFHVAEYGPEGVHIHNGNRSLRKANDNQVGIHSFAEVGTVSYIPITDDMITAQHTGAPLNKGVYVTLPENTDMDGKTFLVVLGGYLQVLGKTYTRVGERTYRIELPNLMLLERFYDSWDDMDLDTELGLTKYEVNNSMVSVFEFFKDETIRRYLTLSQSFFVAVDADTFFHELVALETTKLPSRYYDSEVTQYPLIGAYGRMLEYHPIVEDGVTVLCTTRNVRHRYDFHRRKWRDSTAVDDGRYPAHSFDHTNAYYRIMGTQH